MPRKLRPYILTATAERDFREARQWSLSRSGKELAKQYFTDLHENTVDIAENQQYFANKGHLAGVSGLNIHPVREHYLLYVPVSENCIVIVALIRQTRDVPAILKANGFLIQRQLKVIFEKLEQKAIPNLPK